LEDNRAMTDLSFSIPPAMLDWLKRQVSAGTYVDVGDYLRDLVRREQEDAEKIEWMREQIAIGLASGIVDQEPEDVIEDIIAARRARHG
jgi:antitoxin ParD1/3/4